MKFVVKMLDETTSTNADLKRAAAEGAPFGSVIVAKRQSGGRGRMGREFFSCEGGLYMSLLLPLENPQDAGLLTTFAAVATARAIEAVLPVSVKIKWVNDLLVGGKKVCGILCEGLAREDGYCAVVGIGVNISNRLPDELAEIATNLCAACDKTVEPVELAEAVLAEFADFEDVNFKAELEEYRHRCAVIGKNITVIPHQDATFEAKALDVLDDGSLLVQKAENGEQMRIFCGEVSTKMGGDEL